MNSCILLLSLFASCIVKLDVVSVTVSLRANELSVAHALGLANALFSLQAECVARAKVSCIQSPC